MVKFILVKKSFGGGRMGDNASKGITEQLVDLGFTASRMKLVRLYELTDVLLISAGL